MTDRAGGPLILITGGVRSGKSSFAEQLAAGEGRPYFYLATARVEDEAMRMRVRRHQSRRPDSVQTLEEPLEPHLVVEREGTAGKVILVDCLTLLISNRFLADIDSHGAVREGENIFADELLLEEAADRTLEYIKLFAETASKSPAEVIVVTNEVGMGVVPEYPVGRVYRDLSGRANQLMAQVSDQVWFVLCGLPQRFK
jgi:adenosylcobinamide kinase / adenosylcobinamide-phosphate guanylyltransferase